MKNKKAKVLEKIYSVLVCILFLCVGGAGGVLLSATLFSGFFNPFEVIIGLVGILFTAYISIILHEAGHLVFGLISDYGFSSFRIGSFMWIKQDGGIRLRRFSLAGTGGQCLMTPPCNKDGKIPVILYNLGGVIANILLCAVFAIIYFLWVNRAVLLALIFLLGAIISFIFALLNGIPISAGGIANDGMNALHLSKNPDAAEAFRKQLLMNAAQSAGAKLSDMPDEWFTLPDGADMQNVHCASLAVFAVNRSFTPENTTAAEKEISDLLNSGYNIIGLHRGLLTCDLIYCRLVNNPDADISSLLTHDVKKIMQSMKTYPAVIRTEYVIALFADKNEKKADLILSNFDKNTKKFPYPQEISSERELMMKAREIYKNRI